MITAGRLVRSWPAVKRRGTRGRSTAVATRPRGSRVWWSLGCGGPRKPNGSPMRKGGCVPAHSASLRPGAGRVRGAHGACGRVRVSVNDPNAGRARGGIGRRAGLRIPWSNPCRFDPCRAHQRRTRPGCLLHPRGTHLLRGSPEVGKPTGARRTRADSFGVAEPVQRAHAPLMAPEPTPCRQTW